MAHLACENFQAARDTFEEALDELEDHRGRTAGLMLFYQNTQWSQMVSACSYPVRIGLDSSEVITYYNIANSEWIPKMGMVLIVTCDGDRDNTSGF